VIEAIPNDALKTSEGDELCETHAHLCLLLVSLAVVDRRPTATLNTGVVGQSIQVVLMAAGAEHAMNAVPCLLDAEAQRIKAIE